MTGTRWRLALAFLVVVGAIAFVGGGTQDRSGGGDVRGVAGAREASRTAS